MSVISDQILLVIDNIENLIKMKKEELQMLFSIMLNRVGTLRILMTSQHPLQPSSDFEFSEEIIKLSGLSNIQAVNLFKDVCGRQITQAEINDLLKIKPDKNRYPQEQHKTYRSLHEHHLFSLLNGNPQSINFVASQLADP